MDKREQAIKRFINNVVFTNSCWFWMAGKNEKGYGRFFYMQKEIRAHRFAYAILYGAIPTKLTIDHLCRNPSCVNPTHLEAVTMRENILRGISPMAKSAKQTHCKNGHPFNEENTYYRKRGEYYRRNCRACRIIYDKKRRLSKLRMEV